MPKQQKQTVFVQKQHHGSIMYQTQSRVKHVKKNLNQSINKRKKLQKNNINSNKIVNEMFQLTHRNRMSCNNNCNSIVNTSFDAKSQNQKTFNDYYQNMANTANDPKHPKLQMLLNHLKNNHKIGVDIGAGTGHVSDCIIRNKPGVSKIFCVDLDDKFVERIKKLNNKKIITVHGNACSSQIFDQLPKKVDFLICNSVVHELISYGCNYDKQQFFDSILPNWLSIIKDNGFFFIRDFVGVKNDDEIKIKIKNNNPGKLKIVQCFLQSFFQDWKSPRRALQYEWHDDLLTIKDLDSLLEIFLSFRWGHLDDAQYKGVIDEQFINFDETYLINFMTRHGFCLVEKIFYFGEDYQKIFDEFFDMDESHRKMLQSKGVFLFQKSRSLNN